MVILYPTKLFGWVMIVLFAVASFLIMSSQIVYTSAYVDTEMSLMLPATLSEGHHQSIRAKSPLVEVKGIYLTAYSAGSSKKIDEIIKLIDRTELNAVVIDIKDYSGLIFYDSQVPLVNALKLKEKRLGDIRALIDKLHRHKIYVIARQSVFQDPILAEKKPEWSIKSTKGGLWRDNKGLAWVDAGKKEVWDYNVSIAKEAIGLGFDEINFDYVRFPTDGRMSEMIYSGGEKKKYQILGEFYAYVSKKLAREPAWISIDMFGLVMEKKGEDDMAIGQRIVDANNQMDYICPMMYPSHYPSGHLDLKNPAAHPAEVIDNGMKKGMALFKNTRAQPRPWLQAFDLGAVYGAVNIREQIDAVEKYAKAGWLLWNASNRYSDAGLKVN